MDKSLLIFIAVGVGFLYFITNFIGDIQKEDDKFANTEYTQKHQYDKYIRLNAIGQKILVVTDTDENTQLSAWHNSTLKQEFLEIFPDYADMRQFANNRVKGEFLKKKILSKINKVEGTFNVEEAKRTLDTLE